MYYVTGEIKTQHQVDFLYRTEDFFKDSIEWFERNIGPDGADWYYMGTDYESLPLYIAIKSSEILVLYKLAFPFAKIICNPYDGLFEIERLDE